MQNKTEILRQTIEKVLKETYNCDMSVVTLTDYLVDRITSNTKIGSVFAAEPFIESGMLKYQGKWIATTMNCIILCSNCGERLELCYPDGTEVRALPYCPHCGAKMQENEQ